MFAAIFNLFAAVLIGVACTNANTALETRQTDTYVVNGDFSDPLQGTWEQDHRGCCVTPGAITRVRSHGSDVVKFSDPTNCTDAPDGRIDYYIVGTLVNITPGHYYQVSWDYLLSEHWDQLRWKFSYVTVQPRGGHSLKGLDYQRIVKKNEWYTFKGTFHLKANRPRVPVPTNATLHLAYSKCFSGGFPGDVFVDNVQVSLVQ